MDFADIQKAQGLVNEKQAIQRALQLFDEGGRIVQIGLGRQPTSDAAPMGMGFVMVPTAYIDYPQQMVDAIKTAFQGRVTAITDELTKLGVTGMEEAQAAAKKK